ncbi:MAG: head GIN domain-containing protein, partial [Chloroflexota bacterium]
MTLKKLIIMLGIALVGAVGIGCNTLRITGSGNIIRETPELSDFDSVDLAGFGDLVLTQGETTELIIEADDQLMPHVNAAVRGNILRLSVGDGFEMIQTTNAELRFLLTVPDLESIDVSGSSDAEMGPFNLDQFSIDMDGSGDLDVSEMASGQLDINIGGSGDVTIAELEADSVNARLGGSGKIVLAGNVDSQQIQIGGSGNYEAEDLASQTAEVNISGSGNAELWVEGDLDIRIR